MWLARPTPTGVLRLPIGAPRWRTRASPLAACLALAIRRLLFPFGVLFSRLAIVESSRVGCLWGAPRLRPDPGPWPWHVGVRQKKQLVARARGVADEALPRQEAPPHVPFPPHGRARSGPPCRYRSESILYPKIAKQLLGTRPSKSASANPANSEVVQKSPNSFPTG